MDMLFIEYLCNSLLDEVDSRLLLVKNAGRFGASKGKVMSLLSIDITSNMTGLSVAFSCTHKMLANGD